MVYHPQILTNTVAFCFLWASYALIWCIGWFIWTSRKTWYLTLCCLEAVNQDPHHLSFTSATNPRFQLKSATPSRLERWNGMFSRIANVQCVTLQCISASFAQFFCTKIAKTWQCLYFWFRRVSSSLVGWNIYFLNQLNSQKSICRKFYHHFKLIIKYHGTFLNSHSPFCETS